MKWDAFLLKKKEDFRRTYPGRGDEMKNCHSSKVERGTMVTSVDEKGNRFERVTSFHRMPCSCCDDPPVGFRRWQPAVPLECSVAPCSIRTGTGTSCTWKDRNSTDRIETLENSFGSVRTHWVRRVKAAEVMEEGRLRPLITSCHSFLLMTSTNPPRAITRLNNSYRSRTCLAMIGNLLMGVPESGRRQKCAFITS